MILLQNHFKHKDLISFEDRKGHDKRYSINSEKIQSELNWKPKHSFDDGLLKTVEWYLKNENIFN